MSSDLDRFLRAVRTLAKLAHKHSDEAFVEVLGRYASVEQEDDVCFVGTFLNDIGQVLSELRVHDYPCCCVCGRDIENVRADTKHCSPKCRQKAYRSRVTAGPTKCERKRNGNSLALRLDQQKQQQAVTTPSSPAAEPPAAEPPAPPAEPPYDGADDFNKSLDLAYRAVRERVAAGGRGWTPADPAPPAAAPDPPPAAPSVWADLDIPPPLVRRPRTAKAAP